MLAAGDEVYTAQWTAPLVHYEITFHLNFIQKTSYYELNATFNSPFVIIGRAVVSNAARLGNKLTVDSNVNTLNIILDPSYLISD